MKLSWVSLLALPPSGTQFEVPDVMPEVGTPVAFVVAAESYEPFGPMTIDTMPQPAIPYLREALAMFGAETAATLPTAHKRLLFFTKTSVCVGNKRRL